MTYTSVYLENQTLITNIKPLISYMKPEKIPLFLVYNSFPIHFLMQSGDAAVMVVGILECKTLS